MSVEKPEPSLKEASPRKIKRRFRARCQFCEFTSKLNLGPVFAGWDGLAHAKLVHPDREGCVAVIEEIKVDVI